MGLDLYAGPLARYHSKTWELAAQRAGRESGVEVRVVYAAGAKKAKAYTSSEIDAWRDWLQNKYSHLVQNGLHWQEDPSAPYWTDKPDYSGRDALILAAAHAEHPDCELPENLPSSLDADPAYAAAGKAYLNSSICILECHMFLPSGENFLFAAPDAAGVERFISSTDNLAWALDLVDNALWQAGDAEIAEWSRRGPVASKNLVIEGGRIVREEHVPAPASPLMHWAQFGFALYKEALRFSRAHQAPIVTDE